MVGVQASLAVDGSYIPSRLAYNLLPIHEKSLRRGTATENQGIIQNRGIRKRATSVSW